MYHPPVYLFSVASHPDAISINSLDITFFHPDIDFSVYDYLIITSKQAVKALSTYAGDNYKNIPALCISKESAKSYELLGGKVLERGAGYGDGLVDIIQKYPKETKWLYLRARVVASDFVQKCTDEGYRVDEKIVYASECSTAIQEVQVPEDAILIFTSPSSLECFLATHTLSKRSKVVVIGKTTAKAVPKDIEYHISEKTTIQSCIELAKKLY
jgi:uroporphyrinogen-III synthase